VFENSEKVSVEQVERMGSNEDRGKAEKREERYLPNSRVLYATVETSDFNLGEWKSIGNF